MGNWWCETLDDRYENFTSTNMMLPKDDLHSSAQCAICVCSTKDSLFTIFHSKIMVMNHFVFAHTTPWGWQTWSACPYIHFQCPYVFALYKCTWCSSSMFMFHLFNHLSVSCVQLEEIFTICVTFVFCWEPRLIDNVPSCPLDHHVPMVHHTH